MKQKAVIAHLLKPRNEKGAGPIGFDLGGRYVKIVQFQQDAGGVIAQTRPLPRDMSEDWRHNPDGLASLIKQMIESDKFIGRQVVGCIPDGLLEYRNLRLAPMSGQELESAVQAQLDNHLNLPVDKFKTQFLDAGTVWEDEDRRQEIVAMAAPLSVVSDYLALLNQCGLSPVAIDAAPVAAARSVAAATGDDAPYVVLDVGYHWTVLVITRQNQIQFVKRLETGLGVLDQDVAAALRISVDEAETLRQCLDRGDDMSDWPSKSVSHEAATQAVGVAVDQRGHELAQQISKCLQYYGITFRHGRPQAGIVLGGGARLHTLVQELGSTSRVAFQSMDVMTGVDWVKPDENMPPGTLAVAAGLASYFKSDQVEGAAA